MKGIRMVLLVLFLAISGECRALPSGDLRQKLTIVRGNATDIKKVPYQAALISKDGSLACGGAVLNKKFVLTAGHCCDSFDITKIRVGSNNFDEGGSVFSVTNRTVHPKYFFDHDQFIDYDMCIVEVNSTIRFSDTVKTVEIAKVRPEPGSEISVAGWGVTSPSDYINSKSLQSVKVIVIGQTLCDEIYPGAIDMKRVICAGVAEKSTCRGDDGSVLTLEGKAVAVVSTENGCEPGGYPSLYFSTTDPEMRNFIKTVAGV